MPMFERILYTALRTVSIATPSISTPTPKHIAKYPIYLNNINAYLN